MGSLCEFAGCIRGRGIGKGTGSNRTFSAATGRGRGRTAPVGSLETTGSGLIAKIGAGCGPDCMNRPLTRINVTAPTATSPPRTSRRWLTRKRSIDGSRAATCGASVPL